MEDGNMLEALMDWQKKHRIDMAAWSDLSLILAQNTQLSEPVGTDDSGSGETSITATIRLEASRLGVSLWRNNSGVATNRDGRPVRFGLGNDSKRINETMKSSDLIGMTSRGQFVAIEVKRPGWTGWHKLGHLRYGQTYPAPCTREQAQWNFHDYVRRNGGIAGFARCWADAEQLFMGRI
jgi:hypothetical protein